MDNQFNVGDIVWAKLHGHPWWPSIIYNEALTTPQVQETKKEGFFLVSFFGDNSYIWLNPKNLLHFQSNFRSHSNRSNSPLFIKAVNEAVYETNHRAAIGLTCPCLYYSSYRPSQVEGFLEVDLNGYSSGGVYSVKQINGFRQEFEPVQTLSFVQILALDSINVNQDLNFSKEVARVLAFRKAKYAEVDEPYFVAFKSDIIQAPSETKDRKKATVKYQNKKKRYLATHNVKRNELDDCNIKSSEDHDFYKKRHVNLEVVKNMDFFSASDDNKQVLSSAITTKCDDVEFIVKECEHVVNSEKMFGQTCIQVSQGGVDISEKMLYLLNECSRIVLELKQI
ncbi:hypothetical protein LXL04_025910 [Taraxacum kok-saghyz]